MVNGSDQLIRQPADTPAPTASRASETHDPLTEYRLGGNASDATGRAKTGGVHDTGDFLDFAQQRDMTEADSTIKGIPGTVRKAAFDGDDSAQIMRVGLAGREDYDSKPPQLDAAQQKVFDALKTQGLNPTVEKEYYHETEDDPSEYDWVMKANWKDGKNPKPELQTLAHQGQSRRQAEAAQFEQLVHQKDLAQADSTIQGIPDTVRKAASDGDDSAQIMRVGLASSEDYDSKPPKLDAAQQKVFDALKTQGLNPTVEKEFYHETEDAPSECAWVIKANWKHQKN